MFYYISVCGVSACTSPTHLCTLHHPFHLFHYYSENLSALHSLVHSWDFMTEKENNWLYITIISSCCDQLPFLPDTTCVCQRHRRETTVPRGRLCPPPQLAWTNPPGKSNTHRELTHTHTHTPAPPTRALQTWAIWCCLLTWSQRAICRVFQRETPVVSSRFMLPRNTTRFTRWFLQLACWWNKDSQLLFLWLIKQRKDVTTFTEHILFKILIIPSSPQALQTTKCIFKDEPKLCWKVLKLKCISGTKHVHDCSLPPAVRLWSPPLGAAGVQLMSLIRDRFMVVRQQRPSRPNINEVAETWLEPAVAIFSLI